MPTHTLNYNISIDSLNSNSKLQHSPTTNFGKPHIKKFKNN